MWALVHLSMRACNHAQAKPTGARRQELSEHSVDEPFARRSERAHKYLGWPMLLLLKARP